jgi:NADH dehydrogenase
MSKVVIIGGGFGGLACAKRLQKIAPQSLQLTLIDSKNHHLFQPLLYQVAMAGLSPADIAMPIRTVLAHSGVQTSVLMGTAHRVDLNSKRIYWDGDDLEFDFLVMACGAAHSYFGHENWEPFAPGLKTIEQATEIRRRVLYAFEAAEKAASADEQREYLTFAIVGGGPTGVELAGALGEISRFTLAREFKRIDPRRTRIILIEAGPRILPSFDEELSQRAARDLEKIGVTVWTSTKVTDIRPDGVLLGSEALRCHTILWAAGVRPPQINQTLGVPLDPRGRIIVDRQLNIPGYPHVFAIGDQVRALDPQGNELPGLAPVALQQGRYVAQAIIRRLQNQPFEPFRYWDKGQMATIGRKRAVAQVGRLRFGGFIAYLAWVFIYVYYLVGFKNKVFVMLQWVWSYFFYRRGARLIVDKEWRSFPTMNS